MGALLFPGQGSQIVGMGSDFYNNFEKVKKIFKEADEKLNFPITKIIFDNGKFNLSSAWLNISLTTLKFL